MKRRMVVALSVLILLSLSFITLRIIIPSRFYGLIDILSLFAFILNIIYFWFGVPRLIVYSIYGVFMIPSLFVFLQQYHILLIFVFTIIIVLNPLAGLEQFLTKNLKDNYTKTYKYKPFGKYQTFYKYQEEMKNHYHLPQTQKYYTKAYYRFISTASVLILFFSLIFLLLFSSSDIVIDEGWNPRSFLTLYLAILFTIALLTLYKKGFISTSRVFKIGIFPPIIVMLIMYDFNIVAKIITISGFSIGFLVVVITEVLKYYARVVYSSYQYYDPSANETVYANALFETYVYSSLERFMKIVEFKLPEELFNKNFHSLLMHTNYYNTIITAYTLKKGKVKLYLEYYKEKDFLKVKRSIKRIYNVDISKIRDYDEQVYETKFLHNHEYIIAKAIKLSNLLVELDINKPVIIGVFIHFSTVDRAKVLANKYQTKLLEEEKDYCLVESTIKLENLDYLIETNLRNLLLEMLINGGTFVKVMVYY